MAILIQTLDIGRNLMGEPFECFSRNQRPILAGKQHRQCSFTFRKFLLMSNFRLAVETSKIDDTLICQERE